MTGGGGGGLQQSVVPYAAALARAGHEVLVVILKGSPFIPDLEALDVEVLVTRWRRKPWPFSWLQARAIRAAAARFGAEIAITFASKGFSPTWRALRGRIPVLTHCGATRKSTIARLLCADGIIVTTDEMGAIVLTMGMPPERVFLLPNFLSGEPVEPRVEDRVIPVVGSLGRFVARKGFADLIRACAVLQEKGRPVQLVLGGVGPERRSLENLAAELAVDADFRGWISNSDKAAFFADTDVFVCPSKSEPFGYIYLEAMQAGIPVVATETVGSRFIFASQCDAVVVAQGDVEALAAGIGSALDDPDARLRMAQNAQDVFLRRFHIDAATSAFEGVLSKSLRLGPRDEYGKADRITG